MKKNPRETPHSFPRKKAWRLESALLGSAFGRSFNHLAGSAFRRFVGCCFGRSFPCLWRMALATFTLCGGVSKRLRPCCPASTPGLYKSAATWSVAGLVATAPGSSSWDGLEATPGGVSKSITSLNAAATTTGLPGIEAHPGRVGVHDSFCTYLFFAAGAAGAVSSQLKGTQGDECLSFSPAPCAGASLCAVGVMFPPALSVRVLEMGLRSSTRKGKKTLLLTDTGVYSRSVPMHRLLLPQLLGYLPFQSYATSTLPMGSLRVRGGECLRALFPSSVAHDISHLNAVRRGVEAVHASRPCLDCRAPQFCSSFRFLCISIS